MVLAVYSVKKYNLLVKDKKIEYKSMEVGTRFGKYAAKISAGLYIQITEDHNIHKTRHDTREQEEN